MTVVVATLATTFLVMAPVVWLALSRFYWTHFEQPGSGYLLYNVARLWLMVVLAAAFWSTGARLTRSRAFIDNVFSGAAAWSIAMVLLAVLHLFYVWMVLPLLTIAVGFAVSDLWRARALALAEQPSGDWGLAAILLKLWVLIGAITLLVTIAIWGHFGGDNDVPGNYLPYYASVLATHTNAPNQFWVHFFASKGHGLAFLATALSDVQGSALVTWLMILIGAGLLWRLADRKTKLGRAIGLLAVAAYLMFYAGQGAYAKPHIIRNLFFVYLIVSFARSMLGTEDDDRPNATARLLVIIAIVILSPLASLALLPLLLIALVMQRRGLAEPFVAVAATIVVCIYNYFQVGLPELHSMPSFIGRWVNIERFSRWADPGLAYIDERLVFLKPAMGATTEVAQSAMLPPPRPLMDVMAGMVNPATLLFLAGALGIAVIAWMARERHEPRLRGFAPLRGFAASAGQAASARQGTIYLLIVLLLIVIVQSYSSGPGSSLYRVTNFAGPVALALGMVIVTAMITAVSRVAARRAIGVIVALVAAASVAAEYPVIASQHWRAGISFIAGANSYAGIYNDDWDTVTAIRLARAVPPGARIDLLSFLPGFSAVPDSPFQRPDGAVYLRDYTKVLYGSADAVAAVYGNYGIEYFLVDVGRDSSLLWNGFSPLFEPESIRSRMRVAAHEQAGDLDLYLLATKRAGGDAGDIDGFLNKWSVKLAAERAGGTYRPGYQNGRRVDLKE